MRKRVAKRSEVHRPLRSNVPQVAVLLESSHELPRAMLRGVMRYVRINGPWSLHIIGGGKDEQLLPDMKKWKGDGIIARIPNAKTAEAIGKSTRPTVLLSLEKQYMNLVSTHSRCATLSNDSKAIGQMAAEFFLEQQQFSHFAFLGDSRATHWSQDRQASFTDRIKKAELDVSVFQSDSSVPKEWWQERKEVIRWLKTLPRPIAIFAANDQRGRQALDACMAAGITVPYEATVLGVDNDQLVCETGQPTLSSIAVDSEKAGFVAAEMLDRMFKGLAPEHLSYGPLEIVQRESTNLVPVSNPVVIKALEFIRINTGFQIRVSDVAKHLKVTPRWLEIHFKQSLGYSVMDEIKEVRLKRVCCLLTETDIPCHIISQMCGFESTNYLLRIFKQKFGMTMTDFQKRVK